MLEKENPIDRVWAWQFLFPLYMFAFGLLAYIIVAVVTKEFDLWLLSGITALIVISFLTKLVKKVKNGFYYYFDANNLIIKQFGSQERSIPYQEIKLVVLTGNYYLFNFSRLYRITLEFGAVEEKTSTNELYNVLSRPSSPMFKLTLADIPGFMLGAFHIPAVEEENVKNFLKKLLAVCKDTSPEIEGYFLSDSLVNFIDSNRKA